MSDETKVDIEELFDRLRTLADPSRSVTRSEGYRTACDAIDCIRRLRAEVERWKPREMTLEEVCDVLNEHRYCLADEDDSWCVGREGLWIWDGCNVMMPFEATAFAEKLLRDAAKGGAA